MPSFPCSDDADVGATTSSRPGDLGKYSIVDECHLDGVETLASHLHLHQRCPRFGSPLLSLPWRSTSQSLQRVAESHPGWTWESWPVRRLSQTNNTSNVAHPHSLPLLSTACLGSIRLHARLSACCAFRRIALRAGPWVPG